MKFQRSTVILVGVALLLGAGVLIAESQRARTPETAELGDNQAPILDFAETDVATLMVERAGETLVFERDEQDTWQMVEPETSPAEPGAVAFLLSRLNTDAPLQMVTMGPDQVSEFGFTTPLGTATVTLKDGTKHVLILGGEDFSGNANYAVIDPSTWPPAPNSAEYDVLVVTRDVANGINRPLEEWKMPVEAPTPDASTPTQPPQAEDSAPDSSSNPSDGDLDTNTEDTEARPTPAPGSEADTTD
jgi:hypothetical protein